MGSLNRMVEVDSKDNSILWDCKFLQRHEVGDKSIALYRVHFTTSLYPCYFTSQWKTNKEKGVVSSSYSMKVCQTAIF
ncbi:MAG: hypothetical protein IPN88_15715 [Bacteroidetes bacterium]|nr:hypothetical protein [Bacteroidota bacterium]